MRPAHILVAVSGGSDSIGLLVSLHSVILEKSFRDISLSAISIDHGLRDEAKYEAKYVADLCMKLDIPHKVVCWEGKKPKTGLMAAARESRYDLIYANAMEIGATIVVTAHTFDDQLETVYMRSQRDFLGKGIGVAGISNIVLYKMKLWIYRPFLKCRRESIRDFLLKYNISWCDDPSNDDCRFERVRTRKLIKGIDVNAMFKKIEEFQNWRILLGDNVSKLIPKYLKVYLQSVIAISQDVLTIDPFVLSHLLRISVAVCGGQNYLPGYSAIERVMSFLKYGKNGSISVGRVVLDWRLGYLWITRSTRDLPIQNVSSGETVIWDGRYKFKNLSKETIVISSRSCGRKESIFGIPPIVANRAFLSMPSMNGGQPLMAPFSRFLTGFDLPIAYAFSASFGKKNIPQVPFFYEKYRF
ncbi:tRNA(Ile)-lysidine synthetase [Candidatus Liberibacter americanus str. Sao Paulo]|uniref:tRNA(Ile)-lysidine synthase n=2 Tax=Candidatus Liberibacter americanus TaxID=309868 RepID=U6B941_9HYPH|nr:tRNA(Ile)-lysidine synthetase [Candidatus Liberibacter americanus str. Sao Paulo]EMS36249.1 hypothetical protein G653_02449 [Candidatus Liberibacter americanus PW_SP]